MEPDAEVGPGGRKELFPILLNLDPGESADRLLDLCKVVTEGAHPTVFSRSLSS